LSSLLFLDTIQITLGIDLIILLVTLSLKGCA